MEECDPVAAGADAGLCIDQGVACVTTRREGLIEIGHPVADVVDSRATTRQESTDGRVGFRRFEELHLGATEVEMDDPCPIDRFGGTSGQAENVAVKAQRRIDTFDGDAEMGNSGIHMGNI